MIFVKDDVFDYIELHIAARRCPNIYLCSRSKVLEVAIASQP